MLASSTVRWPPTLTASMAARRLDTSSSSTTISVHQRPPDGTNITAVLDFEEVTYRSRVADLAKAAALLGTRYHGWGPTSQLVREAFVAAYRDQGPLTSAEQNELPGHLRGSGARPGWA